MYKLDHSKAGFTLIEILIAIMLLAFISLYTFKMVDNSTDTKDRVLKEDQTLLQTLTAISRLDSDITQMYSPLFAYSKANPATDPNAVYQDNASSKGTFDGKAKNGMIIPQFLSEDKSTLVFLTAANRRKVADAKESRYTWVRYSLRRSEKSAAADADKVVKADEEIVRQTISSNIYNSDLNWSDVKAQVLLTEVKSVEFSFWDERTKKYVSSLQDLNENKNTIRSLKMDLVWIDENNNEQKISKIYRILHPFFNTKLDDIATGGAYGDSTSPPNVPDPNNPQGTGGSGVHY
jgi:prepilin-type N-terminal cleavage/methylation domain-containing protein